MGDRSRLCTKPTRVHYLAATAYLHVRRVHVRTHRRVRQCCCVRGASVSDPLWDNARHHLCHYSVRLAYYLSGLVCVCVCLPKRVCCLPLMKCSELMMKRDFKCWLRHFIAPRDKEKEGVMERQINTHHATYPPAFSSRWQRLRLKIPAQKKEATINMNFNLIYMTIGQSGSSLYETPD